MSQQFDIAAEAEKIRANVRDSIEFHASMAELQIKIQANSLRRSISQQVRRMREDRLHKFWAFAADHNVDPKYWAFSLIDETSIRITKGMAVYEVTE